MLFLRDDELHTTVSMPDALEVVAEAFAEHGDGQAVNLVRQRMHVEGVTLHVLGGASTGRRRFVVKSYLAGHHAKTGIDLLYEPGGRLLAAMESGYLSRLRTGAATAVATRWLSREESTTVGLIGTGSQAGAQLEAVAAVRPLRLVKVWSPTPRHVNAFCERASRQLDLPVEPASGVHEATRGSDIVITVTSAVEPFLTAENVSPGMHLNLVGANRVERRETALDMLARSDTIVTDDRNQARVESGELLAAVESGAVDWDDVVELGAVVTGRAPGRRSHDDVTVFKSLGVGIEDVAVCALAYERAMQHRSLREAD